MKIAIIGSAPSSIALAPYSDPEWKIWGCSPGAATRIPRADLWFEIHRWEPTQPWFEKAYIDKMNTYGCPVMTIDHIPAIPNSVPYPKDEMLLEFGPYFFTSSVSWMMALAISQGATEIGIYGVDMSHTTEWEFQRSGCHYFIQEAARRGIKVTVPPESDLLRPPPLYGFREVDPMHIKVTARRRELEPRLAELEAAMQRTRDEFMHLRGAMDDLTYMEKTWVTDPVAGGLIGKMPEQSMTLTFKPVGETNGSGKKEAVQ